MIDTSLEGKVNVIGDRVVQLNTTVIRVEKTMERVAEKVEAIYERVVSHHADIAVLKHVQKSKREVFLVWLKAIATFAAPLLLGALGAAAAVAKMGTHL